MEQREIEKMKGSIFIPKLPQLYEKSSLLNTEALSHQK